MTPANGTIAIALDTSHVFMKSAAAWVGLNAAAQNPIGEIIMFPSWTSPANFLLCDGRAYDRTLYPALHIALGSPANAVLPDLRGQFIRGAATGRNPLTTQAQSTARPANAFTGVTSTDGWHSHSFQRGTGSNFSGDIKYPDGKFSPINAEGGGSTVNGGINANGNHTHNVTINGGGDSETRPANIALAFHIRATQ
jgi:hypothetical protein